MVTEMNDISANLRKTLGDHILPRVSESLSENIQCSDVVGVSAVVASDTIKALSSSIFLCHHSTAWTVPRGVSGIYSYKTNTVLLCQLLDPCYSLSVCPWGNCLAKLLIPTLLLP